MNLKDWKDKFDKAMENFDPEEFMRKIERRDKDHAAGYPLDNLPWNERGCYCKEGDSHCAECMCCGAAGHLRGFGPGTFAWCDACFAKRIREDDEDPSMIMCFPPSDDNNDDSA